MNLFWKLFLSIIVCVLLGVCVGSAILIQYSFQDSINSQTENAYKENDILYFSLNRDIARTTDIIFKKEKQQNVLLQIAQSISSQTATDNILFGIYEDNGNALYTSNSSAVPANIDTEPIRDTLTEDTRGHMLLTQNTDKYVSCIRTMKIDNNNWYLATYKDITSTFENKEKQYYTFRFITIIVLIFCFIAIFIICAWMIFPIRRLSTATKKIAAGNYQVLVPIQGNDEIGMLAQNFNQMAMQLNENIEELTDKTRRQELFTNNFAHELKTPLTSMIGYADIIRSKKLSEENTILYANQIVMDGKRLEAMSMKLMDLIVLKKQDFPFRKVSMKEFFDTVSDTVRPIMKNNNITFDLDVENIELYMEPDLMKTVCINLIDNARKSIPSGHKGHIEVVGYITPKGYDICVTDNGCGMEPEEISKITEAFYMVDKSHSRANGGAGLGLAICSEIIALHHGILKIKSEPGNGTTIHVLLDHVQKNEDGRQNHRTAGKDK